jgi:calcium-dependent protein kinase
MKQIPKRKVKKWERLTTEIDILAESDHPNIVKLYEKYEDARNVYLIMELCTGGELFE